VQKALPLMRDGGSVIIVGSIAGYSGIRGYTTYSATKAALRSYTRTWTREFNDRGIRFNTLSPGPIDTPNMEGQADSPEGADAIRARLPPRYRSIGWADRRRSPPLLYFWRRATAASWPVPS
jgi:NAD(P)-dependent dehydrogenase (short-subunit alcohol dehydrogenase family)